MQKTLSAFNKSLSLIKSDKTLMFLSIFPILVGIALFFLLGGFALAEAVQDTREWIMNFFSADSWIINTVGYVIGAVIIAILYFFSSYFIILVISIFSCVFNDIISEKVESLLIENKTISLKKYFSNMLKRVGSIIVAELKKVSFIAILAIIAFVLSFTAFLIPLSVAISWILVAIQFLDYSWSRHELSFADCIADLKSNFLIYFLSAIFFSFMFSIPVVGIFFLPLAVIHFTVLFVRKQIDGGINE